MALTTTDSVIDFGHNTDRVTLKLKLDGPLATQNTNDFTIQVIVMDVRTGERHDTGPQAPITVR